MHLYILQFPLSVDISRFACFGGLILNSFVKRSTNILSIMGIIKKYRVFFVQIQKCTSTAILYC